MKTEVYEYIKQCCVAAGHGDDYRGNGLYRYLVDSISRKSPSELIREARWWDEYDFVVDIGGKDIAFVWAKGSGDMSIEDRGFEFDWDTVRFVELYTETVHIIKWRDIS